MVFKPIQLINKLKQKLKPQGSAEALIYIKTFFATSDEKGSREITA